MKNPYNPETEPASYYWWEETRKPHERFPSPAEGVDEVAKTEDVNLLKRRLEFYRNETAKIRDYVFDDANKCGYPTQSIFEAITDKIDALKAEIANGQSRQGGGGKTLQECKDEVAKLIGYKDWNEAWEITGNKDILLTQLGYIINASAELYAAQIIKPKNMKTYTREEVTNLIDELLQYPEQLKEAVNNENTDWDGENLLSLVDKETKESIQSSANQKPQTQEGWVSIETRMPEENQVVDIWKMWQDGQMGRSINVVYRDEHICEFTHWMPAVLPPPPTNEQKQ